MNSFNYNRLVLVFTYCTVILLLITGCNSHLNKIKQADIDRVAAKWVPDNREGICTIRAALGKGGSVILHGETNIPQAKQEIIAQFTKSGVLLIDSILVLPDTVKNNKYLGLITLSTANLRKKPDHKSELVSQAILGTPVLILKNDHGWLLIQTPDKYIAWTEKTSVTLMNRKEMNLWKKSDRFIFMENSGWVYSSPEHTSVVSDLVAGNILVSTGKSNGYTKVTFPDGREGYVSSDKVMNFKDWESQVQFNGDNICRIASTFLGVPYLWGGSSSKAVDCSGFVQSVYFLNGVILSRDASLQALHGFDVDISKGFNNLNKGDLLFFGTKDNIRSHVTHTAIFIGDNEYINSSGRVLINSLDSSRNNFNPDRKNSLLMAKRIIGVDNDNGIVPVHKHAWY